MTGLNGIHSRGLEETNGLVYMLGPSNGQETHLGQRFSDPDNGLQLPMGKRSKSRYVLPHAPMMTAKVKTLTEQ